MNCKWRLILPDKPQLAQISCTTIFSVTFHTQHYVQVILQTFNNLWQSHVFPETLKESIIIAIPKPGKDKSNPNSYRPIALTSCLGKLLERMVAKRLSFIFEVNKTLSKYQCGFRRNHSTIDHLIRLETDIRRGYKSKKHTVAVFLDISKAYDMVHKPTLIHKIYNLGIRGPMAYYLRNFLSGPRKMRVRAGLFSPTSKNWKMVFLREAVFPLCYLISLLMISSKPFHSKFISLSSPMIVLYGAPMLTAIYQFDISRTVW